MAEQENVVIVGSGPAGLTAAIYAARANLKPLVLAGYQWGGQLMNTTEVENYPGFPEGILGPDLMEKMKAQAERFGAKLVYRDVRMADLSKRPFKINDGETEYETKSLIVATGARPRKLNIPGEDTFWGKGVSSCATCDGAFFKDKVVAVIGGGDSAMEEATFLTRFASKVYLVHRREGFRASDIMLDRARNNDKIEFVLNTVVKEVKGTASVGSLQLEDVNSHEERELPVDGVFLAIGHIPEVEVVKDHLSLDELGYLTQHEFSMSEVPGVFIAGDVHDHRYRQAVTAAGAGCKAAIDVERWLESQAE